jgi:serine-type D-Ala-D-Ala carboxypeptidase (penicillin-binding protein 5/6)
MRPAARIRTATAAAALAAGCVLAGGGVVAGAQPAGALPARPVAENTLDAAASPAGVTAAAAELVDATTGRVLWTRNFEAKRAIASITKVMTAYVVIEAGQLNRKIRVTEADEEYGQQYDPSEAGLQPGDLLTTRQVLEALLLPSGDDAAYLLATTYGPGWPAFVRKMNAAARKLGMTRTHYANFDGLPWPTEHSTYSTAHDLILLAETAMKLPAFRQIVAQRSHWIGATAQHHHYYWTNTNLLLGSYKGAIGIKTGFTQGAGYCLLFAARKGSSELVGVVLDSTRTNAQERFTAATNALNWGFADVTPAGRRATG